LRGWVANLGDSPHKWKESIDKSKAAYYSPRRTSEKKQTTWQNARSEAQMMDNFRSQFAILATQDRTRDTQHRKGLIDGSGKRIFRIGRDRFETQPTGRR
jgi:hypothetical protein